MLAGSCSLRAGQLFQLFPVSRSNVSVAGVNFCQRTLNKDKVLCNLKNKWKQCWLIGGMPIKLAIFRCGLIQQLAKGFLVTSVGTSHLLREILNPSIPSCKDAWLLDWWRQIHIYEKRKCTLTNIFWPFTLAVTVIGISLQTGAFSAALTVELLIAVAFVVARSCWVEEKKKKASASP